MTVKAPTDRQLDHTATVNEAIDAYLNTTRTQHIILVFKLFNHILFNNDTSIEFEIMKETNMKGKFKRIASRIKWFSRPR